MVTQEPLSYYEVRDAAFHRYSRLSEGPARTARPSRHRHRHDQAKHHYDDKYLANKGIDY